MTDNFETIFNYNYYEEEEDSEIYHRSLSSEIPQEITNIFIDNNEEISRTTIQNNIGLQMNRDTLSPQKILNIPILNQTIKDKEEQKEKNKNIIINDINIEISANFTLIEKKNNATESTTKEEINKNNIEYFYNKICKAKILIINVLIKFLNYIISKIYDNKIGNGPFRKELKNIDMCRIKLGSKDNNKKLMNTTLKEILSTKIKKTYTSYPPKINNIIIDNLLNEKDEEKRQVFNNLFNKSFGEWINCFKNPKNHLKKIYEEQLKLKNDKKELIKIIENFEKYI